MASEAEGCLVCGASLDEDALKCPSCGTLLPGQTHRCEHCGEVMQAYMATCPYCGKPGGAEEPENDADRSEVVRRLALAPGIDDRVAAALYRDGIRDFSELVALSLPESEREKGLHKILARRIILSELKKDEKIPGELVPCARCGGPVPVDGDVCEVCGAPVEPTPEMKMQELGGRVGEAITEVYGQLADDASFRRMPKVLQEELMDAISEVDEDELLRQEYREQIDAWREKGFDVEALEKLLDWDIRLFKEESLKIIKAQIQRRDDEGKCPLCMQPLPDGATLCPNCGARFD